MKKIIKNTLIASTILLTIVAGFTGCKKGSEDPIFSIHTRKARVAGDWKVSKYSMSYVYNGDVFIMSFDGANWTLTSGGSTNTLAGSFTMKFEKKGNYSTQMVMIDGSVTTTISESGTWNFTGGVGDLKKKSQLVLTPTSASTNDTSPGSPASINANIYTGIGELTPIHLYNIIELKNKELKLEGNSSDANSTTGNPTDSENETVSMTLTQ